MPKRPPIFFFFFLKHVASVTIYCLKGPEAYILYQILLKLYLSIFYINAHSQIKDRRSYVDIKVVKNLQ
jgi:hypothetical protein